MKLEQELHHVHCICIRSVSVGRWAGHLNPSLVVFPDIVIQHDHLDVCE